MACKIVLKPHRLLFQQHFVHVIHPRVNLSNKGNEKDNKPQNSEEVTKESLQWRTPWEQREGEWYTKFKVFASDHNNTDIIKFLQSPFDLRPSTIKKWLKRKEEDTEIYMQQYIPERNRILGDDLAASHFIVHRGGSVKFHGDDNWIKRDENLQFKLPNVYVSNKIVQAIDCSNMKLYYEGLANFRGLKKLEWLSLNNCEHMNDWCLDRVSGIFKDSIIYLDIRNCNNITDRGVGALYRTTKLKTLYINDVKKSKAFELTCLMLQELLPELEIKM